MRRNMQKLGSFGDCAVVSCGTLVPELTHLRHTGFLDARKILYTAPGRHEIPRELERQLVRQISVARRYARNVIVVYGGRFCYINVHDPYRTIDRVIEEQGPGISRINASHCIDMLAGEEEREQIGEGEKVWWMTPGWIRYRKYVFQDWDKGKAVENFPRHTGGAIVLDGIDFWDQYSQEHPEEILEFSDWMGIPIDCHKVSLHRLENLLLDARGRLS